MLSRGENGQPCQILLIGKIPVSGHIEVTDKNNDNFIREGTKTQDEWAYAF
jgi:hypothetical protein